MSGQWLGGGASKGARNSRLRASRQRMELSGHFTHSRRCLDGGMNPRRQQPHLCPPLSMAALTSTSNSEGMHHTSRSRTARQARKQL